MTIKLAFSTCPNDIFLIYALMQKKINIKIDFDVSLLDIDSLNKASISSDVDIIKISAANYKNIKHRYELLSIGNTLGYNYGPKLVAKTNIKEFCDVFLPGRDTSAAKLFKMFFLCKKEHHLKYNLIISSILNNELSAGTIIHEDRFLFKSYGLLELADLGELWKTKTSLPIPLGCTVINKNILLEKKQKIKSALQLSLEYASNNRNEVIRYINNTYGTDIAVIEQYLNMYVNDDSYHLSSIGHDAIKLINE